MKILLLGANGQVGWQLRRSLVTIGEVIPCTRSEINIEENNKLIKLIRQYNPSVIVNASAYTAVDKAEKEKERAESINSVAVGVLAKEARELDALLVHYSTDYIFDGKKLGSYNEDDTPNPISVYGKTKLSGERKIIESGCNHLIFRTSWVYSERGVNFIKTIIRLAKERKELKIISDQIGSPTSADFIADITVQCILQNLAKKKKNGIFNLTANGEVSWHGFAQFILEELYDMKIKLQATPDKVIPIPTSEYPLPAKRPPYSKLDTKKITQTFNINIPNWEYHAKLMLSSYYNNKAGE